MRALALMVGAVMLGMNLGCAPGANGELRALVEEAELPETRYFGCEWGSSTFANEPKAWYGCWDYVPGDLTQVAKTFRSRLASKGFKVLSRRVAGTVQFTAFRGADTLCVDVLAAGFGAGRNTSPPEVDISPGEVFVDVWTSERRQSAEIGFVDQCPELPAPEEEL
jgi:hypothetical protein